MRRGIHDDLSSLWSKVLELPLVLALVLALGVRTWDMHMQGSE